MSRKKRNPNKRTYRKKGTHLAVVAAELFAPFNDFLNQVRNGEVETLKGYPIIPFSDRSDAYYAHEAFYDMAVMIHDMGKALGDPIDVSMIFLFSNRLAYWMTIDEPCLNEVVTVFNKAQVMFSRITPEQASTLNAKHGQVRNLGEGCV